MKLKIKLIGPDAKAPRYAHEGDSGMDCYATQMFVLRPGDRALVPLGFAAEIPVGHEIQIRPRSGLARYFGVAAVVGTIDSGYRSEICAIVFNHDLHDEFRILPGDRICQAVVAPVTRVEVVEVDELSATERGAKGFGSSGTR